LQAILRPPGRTGANRGATQRTCSGTNRGTSTASNRGTQAGAEKCADDRGADLPVIRLLRTAADLSSGELLAQRLVALKGIERLAVSRHHRDCRPQRFGRAPTQKPHGQQDGSGELHYAQSDFLHLYGVDGTIRHGV
jgi:hypothetical protein